MKQSLVTLTNNFHATSSRVRTGKASPETVRRVRRELCGIAGCTCGDDIGVRGPQRTDDGRRVNIDANPDGSADISID